MAGRVRRTEAVVRTVSAGKKAGVDGARDVIVAIPGCPCHTIAGAAKISERAVNIAVLARSCERGAQAVASGAVARIAGAAIAIVAVHRRVVALPGRGSAQVLGAQIAVAAIRRRPLADWRAGRGRDAGIAGSAEALIVAGTSRGGSGPDAVTGRIAGVRRGAGIPVIASLAWRQGSPHARSARIAGIRDSAG